MTASAPIYRVNPQPGGAGQLLSRVPVTAAELEPYLNSLAEEGWMLDCTVRGIDGADMLVFIQADAYEEV